MSHLKPEFRKNYEAENFFAAAALKKQLDEVIAERDALQKKLTTIHYAVLGAKKGTLAAKVSDFIVFGYAIAPAAQPKEQG